MLTIAVYFLLLGLLRVTVQDQGLAMAKLALDNQFLELTRLNLKPKMTGENYHFVLNKSFKSKIEEFIVHFQSNIFASTLNQIISEADSPSRGSLPNKNNSEFILSFPDDIQFQATIESSTDHSYRSYSLDFRVTNTLTNQTAPVKETSSMPDYIQDGFPFQLLISESAASQFLWGILESEKLHTVFSQANQPASFPISLNTSHLITRFPNIISDYGDNKGVYLQVKKGLGDSDVFIRNGQIYLKLDLLFSFYVDIEGSSYPSQGLENCPEAQCVLAGEFEVPVFFGIYVYNVNDTCIAAKIIHMFFQNVSVRKGDVDTKEVIKTLNKAISPVMSIANKLLEDGFNVPLNDVFSKIVVQARNQFLYVGLSN